MAAVARIGWRSIGRSRGRSALIVFLMLLPVSAMAGAITLIATVSPTAEETATHRFGIAGYEIQEAGSLTTDSLRALLPNGAQVEPWSYDVAPLVLPGRTVNVNAWSMDLDGLARGKLVITDGRQPQNQEEVAITAGLARLAGVGIGDSIQLQGRGSPTVVGMVEDRFDINGRVVLLDASVARESAQSADRLGASPVWLVSLPDGSEIDVSNGPTACVDGCQFVAYSRYQFPTTSDDTSSAILVLGGLALVEAILIAAAAFTVSIRRRQRELGLMAAAGAERRHLAGTVLSEGALLGGLAALIGIVLGVLGVVALSPWLDQLTNRRIGSVVINATALLLAGGIGLAACLMAAWLPARAASRLPVLMALSGRRPPLSPAHRLLVVGLVLVAIGGVLTSTGAAMRLTDAGGTLSLVMLLVGAIVGVLGFGACSPWLIERLERLGLRLPVAARIALRDTARARSRNAPIVTAILAAFAATVAVSSYFASNDAAAAAHWQPWLRSDQIIVQGEGADRAGAAAGQALGAIAAAPIPSLVDSNGEEVFVATDDPVAGDGWAVTIGDAELLKALGAESAQTTLDDGGVVLMTGTSRPVQNATLVVYGGSAGDELRSATLPAVTVGTGLEGGGRSDAVISSATANRLGLRAGQTSAFLIRLPRPVVEADVDQAAGFAAQESNTTADASIGPTRPDQLFRIVLVVLSLLFALSVTGIAVALGEAESRPDQRTLLAVGADPGIRRRIAAARAGVLGLLAGLLAVPAGLLPAWGLLGSRGAPLVVPLPEVVAAVIILPLAGIVGFFGVGWVGGWSRRCWVGGGWGMWFSGHSGAGRLVGAQLDHCPRPERPTAHGHDDQRNDRQSSGSASDALERVSPDEKRLGDHAAQVERRDRRDNQWIAQPAKTGTRNALAAPARRRHDQHREHAAQQRQDQRANQVERSCERGRSQNQSRTSSSTKIATAGAAAAANRTQPDSATRGADLLHGLEVQPERHEHGADPQRQHDIDRSQHAHQRPGDFRERGHRRPGLCRQPRRRDRSVDRDDEEPVDHGRDGHRRDVAPQ